MTAADPGDATEGKALAEQLVEAAVYAPIGWLYEYQNVIPQLVARGRSQVQLAKVLAQMAGKAADSGMSPLAALPLPCNPVETLTEVGRKLGLAAPRPSGSEEPTPTDGDPTAATGTAAPTPPTTTSDAEAEAAADEVETAPVAPVDWFETYDEMTARDIAGRLGSLDEAQRGWVRDRELAGKGRVTILRPLDAA